MIEAYSPSKTLGARISRRITPFCARRVINYSLTRPVISFTFDDCPKSVIPHGLNTIEAEGWRGSLYISSGLLGKTNHHGEQMQWNDVKEAHEKGHEIGCHTYSHIDGTQVAKNDFMRDIQRNHLKFDRADLPPAKSFAYPYGQTSPELKNTLSQNFTGLRGIQPGAMYGSADLNEIKSTPLFSGRFIAKALKQIENLDLNPAWTTFFTHDISETPSNWGCTPGEFQSIVAAAKAVDALVLPVNEAIEYLRECS